MSIAGIVGVNMFSNGSPTTISVDAVSDTPPPTISALTFTATNGASLGNPQGVATNDAGTVYVANTADNVVASVVGSATTTIAGSYEAVGDTGNGGPAAAATLTSPAGLAVDWSGDLFIADTEDNVIREVTPAGTISQVARYRQAGLHR